MKTVVKISGNLLWSTDTLDTLLNTLSKLQNNDIRIAIVPGGSIFADVIRDLQRRLNFDDSTAHWMAIKSMEVYGAFISSRSSYIESADTLERVYDVWSRNRLPLIMPFNIIKKYDELPHSWSVTSDAITVFIAHLLKADIAILTKLVSGIIVNGSIARTIKADSVPLNQNVIDEYTPILIRRHRIPTAIVNAHYVDSLYCLLEKTSCCSPYTLIIP
ncbi:MAG: hypothetical protein QXJ56_07565 [Ignisphaera sp.]|uniref:Aspartate/glutamate/uridylate kinase domain-containing protein n=1 Tax=Ignisphaera aggregans TaxID=334771 RepID=A0A7J3JPA9_9CREN